jgi:hypothetical protein
MGLKKASLPKMVFQSAWVKMPLEKPQFCRRQLVFPKNYALQSPSYPLGLQFIFHSIKKEIRLEGKPGAIKNIERSILKLK